MKIVPITLKTAAEFVSRHHRHNKAPTGHKFSVGLSMDGDIVGVAVASRPVARALDDGVTIEVVRTCTLGDKNANSMLYGAILRCAKAMGYVRAITYTQADESGASLKASGFRVDAQLKPRKNWANSSKKLSHTRDNSLPENISRVRWIRYL